MSKEERAALAIAKRTQEIREQKLKQENARMDREALEREAEEIQLRNNQSNRYGGGSTRRQSINLPILCAQVAVGNPFFFIVLLQMKIAMPTPNVIEMDMVVVIIATVEIKGLHRRIAALPLPGRDIKMSLLDRVQIAERLHQQARPRLQCPHHLCPIRLQDQRFPNPRPPLSRP
jgi:hypothetical protein